MIDDAQKQADALVENNDITVRAKMRADELMQSNRKHGQAAENRYI